MTTLQPAEQPQPPISCKMEQHLWFSSAQNASLCTSPSLSVLLQWIEYLRWHFTDATKPVRDVQCWKNSSDLASQLSSTLHSVAIFLSITTWSPKLRDQSQLCPQMGKFCYFHFVYKIKANCNLFFFCGQNEFGLFHFPFGIPSC